jgi:NADPH2:quinone reductase
MTDTQAIMLRETGGPEQLRLETVSVEDPAPGQLLIRHTAISVNYHDTYVRAGLYQTLPLPGIPGLEAAGVVEKVGVGIADFSPGDRICYVAREYGAYSRLRLLPVERALHVPPDVSDELAATLCVKAFTACVLLRRVRVVRAGDTVLIHAGAGGVGQSLIRWARSLGARVITTVGSAQKAAIAEECGAHHIIHYREENFVDRVRQITAGHGVEVAYDGVGLDTFSGSLDCLGMLGTLVNFGQASGPVPLLAISRLSARSNGVVRPMLFHYIRERAALEAVALETFAAVADGVLKPSIGLRMPLAQAAEAHTALESRATTGSVILTP